MSAGATTGRVYEEIKRRLLAGELHPGERLDPSMLAGPLASSVTPVRDALNQLVGEALVVTRAGSGFFVPFLTEPDLIDLYDWCEELVLLTSRRTIPCARTTVEIARGASDVAGLFAGLARASRNREHVRQVRALNDRLAPPRLCEPSVLGETADELAGLQAALHGKDRGFPRLLAAYHRRRRKAASDIVRAVYRMG